jgi:hypothetical protein
MRRGTIGAIIFGYKYFRSPVLASLARKISIGSVMWFGCICRANWFVGIGEGGLCVFFLMYYVPNYSVVAHTTVVLLPGPKKQAILGQIRQA